MTRRSFLGKRYEDWELDEPAGRDVRPIRDDVERRVRGPAGLLGVVVG